MARTPEDIRAIRRAKAEEFRQQFIGRPGKKAAQRALAPQEFSEVPERAPRNKGIGRPHLPRWDLSVRVSSVAQANIAAILRQNREIVAGFNRVTRQIENHPGQLAVPDTNILLHGVSSKDPRPGCDDIVKMIEDEQITPCVSTGIIAEIRDVARLMKEREELTAAEHARLTAMLSMAINVDPLPLTEQRLSLPADQSDVKFLVVAAKAHRFSRGEPVPVVSMDAHLFTAPEEVMGEVKVMNPRAFLEWLSSLK